MSEKHLGVIVLAAGEGTRMKSSTPKVMHELAGLPLLGHALSTAHSLGAAHVVPVVRFERDQIASYIQDFYPTSVIADQDEVPGTGEYFRWLQYSKSQWHSNVPRRSSGIGHSQRSRFLQRHV
jgi:bifunctional N-acetylglucosamine-1-phosphate-uridyltransferase/glucosamine-1-phosphate-acetyltransferase GlmU-like protein